MTSRLVPSGSRWSFEWRGAYHLPQRTRDRLVSGSFAAIDQQLYACLSPIGGSKLILDTCAGGTWAAVIPEIRGTEEGNESMRSMVGPSFMLALQARERQYAGRIELGVAFPFRKYAFVYTDPEGAKKTFYFTGEVLVMGSISGFRIIP